jgi:hypothetical protein
MDRPHRDDASRHPLHAPLETPEAIARGPVAFPVMTREAPEETFFADWERRLTRNLSRRSDGRWDPLTWTHATEPSPPPAIDAPS